MTDRYVDPFCCEEDGLFPGMPGDSGGSWTEEA